MTVADLFFGTMAIPLAIAWSAVSRPSLAVLRGVGLCPVPASPITDADLSGMVVPGYISYALCTRSV